MLWEISASQKSYIRTCAKQAKVKKLLNRLLNTFKASECYCLDYCSQGAEKEASWQKLLHEVFENAVFLRNQLCQF